MSERNRIMVAIMEQRREWAATNAVSALDSLARLCARTADEIKTNADVAALASFKDFAHRGSDVDKALAMLEICARMRHAASSVQS